MDRLSLRSAACAAGVVLFGLGAVRADTSPYAAQVVSYTPGSGVNPDYTNPSVALGEPARLSSIGTEYQTVVSPFASAWEPTDLVSVGRSGSLVLRFDHPVTDDPANPYGLDLLIFGNSFYEDLSTDGSGLAGTIFAGGGSIEVSADGILWHAVTGVDADGQYPTLGYSDLGGPYQPTPGAVPADFTRPVDPAFVATGKTFAEISAAYNGSGGGAGIDIGGLGLSAVSYVRISNGANAPRVVEIDGMADVSAVPAPWTLAVLLPLLRRRR